MECGSNPRSGRQGNAFGVAAALQIWRVAVAALYELALAFSKGNLQALPKIAVIALLHFVHALASWTEPSRLTRCINLPSIHEAATYTHPSLPPNGLVSRPIEFFQPNGQCLGICIWLLHRFYQHRRQCPDAEECLYRAASEFCQGAPKGAIVLQAIGEAEPIYKPKDDTLSEAIAAFEGAVAGLAGLKVQAAGSDLNSIAPGAYLARIGYPRGHEIVYVKFSKGLSYTFDPNIGLMCGSPKLGNQPLFFMRVEEKQVDALS